MVCVCVFLLGVNNNVSRHCLVHREQICISNGDHYCTVHENSVTSTVQSNKNVQGFTESPGSPALVLPLGCVLDYSAETREETVKMLNCVKMDTKRNR